MCDVPGWFDVSFGAFLTVATFLTFVPQWWKLFSRGSSEGISSLFLVVSNISCAALAICTTLDDWDDIVCCKSLDFWQCTEIMMEIYQMAAPAICYFSVHVLFLIFFKGDQMEIPWWRAVCDFVIFLVYFAFSLTMAIVFLAVFGYGSREVHYYALFQSAVSTLGIIISWAPQIWTTYRLKHGGSLSLIMLCLHLPGCILIVFYALLSHEDAAVWLPILINAAELSLLIGMIVYYDYLLPRLTGRHPAKGVVDPVDPVDPADSADSADSAEASFLLSTTEGDQ